MTDGKVLQRDDGRRVVHATIPPLLALLGALLVSAAARAKDTRPPAISGELSFTIVDGFTDQKLANVTVILHSDNGIRCHSAPCPTNDKTWTGQSNAEGMVTLPAEMVQQSVHLSTAGYQNGCNVAPDKPCRMFPDFAYDLTSEISPQQKEILLKALQNPDPEVERVAQRAFSHLHRSAASAVPDAVILLQSPDTALRLSAAKALEHAGSSGGQPAIPALTRLLRDPDETVRFAAAHALGMIARENAPPETLDVLLAEFAKGYPPGTDGSVMRPLWLRWRSCLPAMVSALESKDPSLRERSSFVLMKGLIFSRPSDAEILKPALDSLFRALEDPDPMVRVRISMALGPVAVWNKEVFDRLEVSDLRNPDLKEHVQRALSHPLLYLSFDRDSGGIVRDRSGNGNDGRVFGASPARDRHGRFNSAYDFDGEHAWIEVTNRIGDRLSRQITVSAWVKRAAPGRNWGRIVSGGSPINSVYNLCDSGGGHALLWRPVLDGMPMNAAEVEIPAELNDWTFVAGTYDGETTVLYLDANVVATKHVPGTLATSTRSIAIGGETGQHEGSGNSSWFNGLIDEVRIYERALTAGEVRALFESTK